MKGVGQPVTPELSLNDLAERHKAFKAQDWKGRSVSEIAEAFMHCYGELPIVHMRIAAYAIGNRPLHRARWVDPRHEPIGSVDTFCYPRSPFLQVMGRANLSGYPVFYTCGSASSAVREASHARNDGHRLYHSEWRFTDSLPWRIAVMVPPHRVNDGSIAFRKEWDQAIREYVMRHKEGSAEYLMLLYQCITELFLSEEYEVTSWIAHRLMRELHVAELLVYPSLMADQKDLCHAFHTDPIDEQRVVLDRVEEIKADERSFTSLSEGFPDGRLIRWERMATSGLEVPALRKWVEGTTERSRLTYMSPFVSQFFNPSWLKK